MQIDDHVPLPVDAGTKQYPFKVLKPGQSFFVPGETTTGRTAGAAHVFATRERKKGFACRMVARNVEENGAQGVRIWRVE